MTGKILKKYHVAVMDEDANFVSQIVFALKSWFNKSMVVEQYTDPRSMFEAINACKAKECPFDLTVMSVKDEAEKMVLHQTDPKMPVLLCKDIKTLKSDTAKILLL